MTAPFIDYLLSDEQASAIATEQMLSEFGVAHFFLRSIRLT
jgi:hypothetical protein